MKTILSTIFFLAFVLMTEAIQGQATIFSIKNPTADSCDGSFQIKVGDNTTSLPVKFYVMQYLDTIETRQILSNGLVNFTGYCPGKYTIEMVNSYECSKPLELEILGCESSFEIRLIAKGDALSSTEPTGMLEVVGFPGTNYVYSWSNGSSASKISNLSNGTYTVTVSNPNTGCQKTASYTIKTCTINQNNPNGAGYYQINTKDTFEIELLGGLARTGTTAFMQLQIKRAGETTFSPYFPGEMDVIWEVNGRPYAFNTGSISITTSDSIEVKVLVSNGCFTKMKSKKTINCQTTDQDYMRRYFVKSIIPACEKSSNGVLTITAYEVKANTGKVVVNGIPMSNTVGYDYTLGGLSSGYQKVEIGIEGSCIFKFDVFIGAIPIERFFISYDNKNLKCTYGLNCNGTFLANETSPATILEADASGCKGDIFCNGVKKGTKKYGLKTEDGPIYLAKLNAELAARGGSDAFLSLQLSRYWKHFIIERGYNPLDCGTVTYCPISFRIIVDWVPFPGNLFKPKIKNKNNGCVEYSCPSGVPPIGLIIKKKIEVCDISSNWSSQCDLRVDNLLQLAYYLDAGRFDKVPGFFGSGLLKEINTWRNHPAAPCARIIYCEGTFQVISNNVISVVCGTKSPNPDDERVNCLYHYYDDLLKDRTIYRYFCNNTDIDIIKYKMPGVTSPGEEKYISDNTIYSKVFSSLAFKRDGGVYPNPILLSANNQSARHAYNISSIRDDNTLISNNEVIASAEDWDLKNTLMIEKTPSNYILSFQAGDSLIEKTLPLSMNIKSLKQDQNKYFITYIEPYFGIPLMHVKVYDRFGNSLFVLDPNIDQLDPKVLNHVGNRFFAVAANKVFISNTPFKDITSAQQYNAINSYTLNFTSEEILAAGLSASTSRLSVLKGTINNNPYNDFNYDLISYRKTSTGYTSAATKVVTYNGGIPNKNNVHIEVDSLGNIYFLTQFRGTLNFGGTLLTTQSYDYNQLINNIAIVKLDSTLKILNTYVAKSNNDINLSLSLLSKNILYFGGMMKNITPTKIGEHKFFNTSKNQTIPYFTYINTDQFPTTTIASAIASPDAESGLKPKIEIKQKSDLYLDAFPNPFKDITTVYILSNEISNLDVIDILGNVVSTQAVDGQIGNIRISNKSWLSGIYFIRGIGKNGEILQTKRIMKLE